MRPEKLEEIVEKQISKDNERETFRIIRIV